MRRRARIDNNQPQIVGELRQLGFAVFDTHRVGQGFPDLCVSRGGITALVEIKNGRGKLTSDEAEFIAGWQGSIIVAKSAEEVLAAFEGVL